MPSNSGYRALCRVVRKVEHNELYFTLWLRDAHIAGTAQPGQIVLLRLVDEGFHLRIPLGVHDVIDDTFAVMVKTVGDGTRSLSRLRGGDLVDVMGPQGRGFTVMETGRALLISGGIGYAPLKLLQRRLRPDVQVQWLHGGRSAEDLFPADVLFTDDGRAARQGFVTEGLREALAGGGLDRCYACGPHPMLAACAALCEQAGVPLEVSLEEYMACGIGVCHGCAVEAALRSAGDVAGDESPRYHLCCKDGPVFDAREVRWHE